MIDPTPPVPTTSSPPTWHVPPTPQTRIDGLQEPEVVHQMLTRRGITTAEAARAFLDPAHYTTGSVWDWPDVREAVDLLLAARDQKTIVCIWGDFDVDGQTSTALLVYGLRRVGFRVIYYIPHRVTEGHGLNAAGLHAVHARRAGLVVTCDCGTSDVEAVEVAHTLGMPVLITDHHTPPEQLPRAAALVNPHRLPAGHPGRPLCGVGVAYILLSALYETLGEPLPARLLEWVALGTIADVAALTDDNRYLVQRGLAELVYRPSVSTRALLQSAGATLPEVPDAKLVGFTLAPRLNAVGRLGHAREAVAFLLADHPEEATQAAVLFERLNDERKQMGQAIEADVLKRLAQHPDLADAPALVLADADWHPGVIGLVAGRLAEQLHKPVVLLTEDADGLGRASGRSVPGVDLHAALEGVSSYLVQEGGHAMAAGFTIQMAQLPAFQIAFYEAVAAQRTGEVARPPLMLEAEVRLADLTLDWIRAVYRLAPFGAGHPVPIWVVRGVQLTNVTGLGAALAHSRMRITDPRGHHQPALWWRKPPNQVPQGTLDVAFTVELDTYLGQTRPRLVIQEVRQAPRHAPRRASGKRTMPLDIVDARTVHDRQGRLAAWRSAHPQTLIWGEGWDEPLPVGAVARSGLRKATELVIWTTPPGPEALRAAVQRVQPDRLLLLTQPQRVGYGSPVQHVLKGLVRYIKATPGLLDPAAAAGTLGHRIETIRLALEQLQVAGHLRYQHTPEGLQILPGTGTGSRTVLPALKALLEETAAYRRYFNRADPEQLIG